MKKILKSMMFLIIGIVSVFATNVHAETYNGGFGDGDAKTLNLVPESS